MCLEMEFIGCNGKRSMKFRLQMVYEMDSHGMANIGNKRILRTHYHWKNFSTELHDSGVYVGYMVKMVKKIVVTCGIRPVPVNFIESHCHPEKCHCTTHFYRFVQEKWLFVIRKVSFYTFYTDNNIYVEWITVIYNSDCANRLQAINANSSISKLFLIKFAKTW